MVEASHHRVPPTAKGERLDAYLVRALHSPSRAQVQSLLKGGHVLLNGKPPKASVRLSGGEQIEVSVPPPAPVELVGEDLPLRILYEDSALAVVDKAPGIVVHPGAGNRQGTLANALMHRMGPVRLSGGDCRSGLVHRLDKDTSGCLLVAKTEKALLFLQSAFKDRQVEKTYWALVHGHPQKGGRIETFFGRHPVHRKRFTGRLKQGKRAITEFQVMELLQGAALVEVSLLTGRTHQIRVHLSEAGHPLLADAVYGRPKKRLPQVARAEEHLGRHALHAWKLVFPHPKTEKTMSIRAPVPEDLEQALLTLRAED